MCGRFSLDATWDELRAWYDLLGPAANLEPRYNIAPTQTTAVLTLHADGMQLAAMRWGLIPSWVRDRDKLPVLINARAETAAEKPSFRGALQTRRCLVPASGYYEWKKSGAGSIPYYISLKDGGPMMFAGLWETWQPPGENQNPAIFSFAVLTTAASEAVANIHHRMPVIVDRDQGREWLSPGGEELLQSPPQPKLANWPIAKKVNSVRNEGADLIRPVEHAPEPAEQAENPQMDMFRGG